MQISSLYSMASPFCPNVPTFVFERAFVSAARKYFDETKSWKEKGSIDVNSDSHEYTVSASDTVNTVPFYINWVEFDGRRLEETSNIPAVVKFTSTPTCFEKAGRHFSLYPRPKQLMTLIVSVSNKPSLDATEIPDYVVDDNEQGLRFGVIAELKNQIGTDWHDPQGHAEYLALFNQEIATKRVQMAQQQHHTVRGEI